jgi:NAD(P)-dependent dehydrogenase (short-subunit alcohol dehydrogenase family)
MSDQFAGKIALVTGGGSGIGFAIAKALADHGASVVIGSLTARPDANPGALTHLPSDADLADALLKLRNPSTHIATNLDVRSNESVDEIFSLAELKLGRVEILVNAAGIGGMEEVTNHSLSAWNATIDVNVTGAFRTIRRAMPSMIEARYGRIVNIASTAGNLGAYGASAYCASKSALLGLTRCAALEGAQYGISCNAINPGQVDTGSTRLSYAERRASENLADTVEKYNEKWAEGNPQKRMIQAEEVEDLCVYLCQSTSFGISAQDIDITGGAIW